VLNVLFLCTGNSARSILAENAANSMGRGRLRAFSAGSHPTGRVNPLVMEFLEEQGMRAISARSKSWQEFAAPDAPRMDLIITVCDSAAGEACPVWPGHPISAHWGVEDPAAHMDHPEKARALVKSAYETLSKRIARLLALPIESMDHPALQKAVREIGSVA
jgi:arsenate reductase (thioredoxin)